jgi:Uma2 family endonuclease
MTVNQLPLPTATDGGLAFEDLLHLDTPEGYRTELFEGRLVVSPPAASLAHAYAATKLSQRLFSFLPDNLMAVQAPGVYYTRHNYYIPDLVVVEREAFKGRQEGFAPEAILLVVEVLSPSSLSHDHVLKRHAYAKAGMKHYWILDPKAKTVRVLRLDGESYVDAQVVELGQAWTAREPFVMTIEPEKLFLQ